MLDFVDKLPQDTTEPPEATEQQTDQVAPPGELDRGVWPKTSGLDAPKGKQTTAFKRRR